MKILGTETRRNVNSMFNLYVVDSLDEAHTITVKKRVFNNADAYKKYIFTNGSAEKMSSKKTKNGCIVTFTIHDGDWLIIMDSNNEVSMYISEQYCGPIKVKNKDVQELIDQFYEHCRQRIDSKREFAKRIGFISRQLNLPFHIVLAFKGNEELLKQMVSNIESSIENRLYENENFMQLLASSNQTKRNKAIEVLGIMNVPEYQSDKIAQYLLECLENKKIIRRFE